MMTKTNRTRRTRPNTWLVNDPWAAFCESMGCRCTHVDPRTGARCENGVKTGTTCTAHSTSKHEGSAR